MTHSLSIIAIIFGLSAPALSIPILDPFHDIEWRLTDSNVNSVTSEQNIYRGSACYEKITTTHPNSVRYDSYARPYQPEDINSGDISLLSAYFCGTPGCGQEKRFFIRNDERLDHVQSVETISNKVIGQQLKGDILTLTYQETGTWGVYVYQISLDLDGDTMTYRKTRSGADRDRDNFELTCHYQKPTPEVILAEKEGKLTKLLKELEEATGEAADLREEAEKVRKQAQELRKTQEEAQKNATTGEE